LCPMPLGIARRGPEYRYLAIRERMQDQLMLPGMEQDEKALPFQTDAQGGVRYKVFGIVTNMDWEAQELIEWHYKRCGRSEQAHSVMKEDLAGGTLPSGDFGENAAWWWIMVLAFNLNAALKSLVLGGRWVIQADESDQISPDQHSGQGHGAVSAVVVAAQCGRPCLWVVSVDTGENCRVSAGPFGVGCLGVESRFHQDDREIGFLSSMRQKHITRGWLFGFVYASNTQLQHYCPH
jgi:hypothetical protein